MAGGTGLDMGDRAAHDAAHVTLDQAVTIAQAVGELGTGALRLVFAVAVALAATNASLAVLEPGAAYRVPEGIAFLGLAVAGLRAPAGAARVLRPRGRIALVVMTLAILIAVDATDQRTITIVAYPAIAMAAVVASRGWVIICVAVSVVGYILGFMLKDHSLTWVLTGPGEDGFANELVDLSLWAAVLLCAITTLRRCLLHAPARLEGTRSGGESLTPELAAAVRAVPVGLLERADPAAVIVPLTQAERSVLELLAGGLAPKQAARELGVRLPTVRTHIASAKRKTGARTLEQLVGLFVEGRDG
jgi:DNA-binding CsgD family transcriptional regulator